MSSADGLPALSLYQPNNPLLITTRCGCFGSAYRRWPTKPSSPIRRVLSRKTKAERRRSRPLPSNSRSNDSIWGTEPSWRFLRSKPSMNCTMGSQTPQRTLKRWRCCVSLVVSATHPRSFFCFCSALPWHRHPEIRHCVMRGCTGCSGGEEEGGEAYSRRDSQAEHL